MLTALERRVVGHHCAAARRQRTTRLRLLAAEHDGLSSAACTTSSPSGTPGRPVAPDRHRPRAPDSVDRPVVIRRLALAVRSSAGSPPRSASGRRTIALRTFRRRADVSEVAHRPLDADVSPAPVPSTPPIGARARAGNTPSARPMITLSVELEPLGVVERKQRHESLVVAQRAVSASSEICLMNSHRAVCSASYSRATQSSRCSQPPLAHRSSSSARARGSPTRSSSLQRLAYRRAASTRPSPLLVA